MRLFLLLGLIGTMIVGTVSAQPPKADAKNKLKVEIAKGKLSINGKELAVPGELPAYEKAFGKPSGIVEDPVDKDNKYIFWNSLGIKASQSQKGKKPVQEVLFSLDAMYDLSTMAQTKPFPGELLVNEQPITKTASKDDIKTKLKGGRDVFGTWRVEYEGGTFYVEVNPSEKGTASVGVVQPLVSR
jgi:hypothetical protein